ncbi:hypothetical protein LGT39_04990 [Demequina sp. TTPB684]|uniref:hypothetical protein n=1 Tax=unclassified Demequina TaxID=2620311 RepID=UPI001CF16F43|nr:MULTISPECIES: hypothetical protein [unclassified Demequina]MCB2412204.1 hypothetical protein [Demequina sp. TTPB684]UPU87322.1 hypothetical protein LGT36_008530 [Demequina sp. TMPB413]
MSVNGGVLLRRLRVGDARVMPTVLADLSLYRFTGGEPPTEAELEERFLRQVTGSSPYGTERWLNIIVPADLHLLVAGSNLPSLDQFVDAMTNVEAG